MNPILSQHASMPLISFILWYPVYRTFRMCVDPCGNPVRSPDTLPVYVFRRCGRFAEGEAFIQSAFAFAV